MHEKQRSLPNMHACMRTRRGCCAGGSAPIRFVKYNVTILGQKNHVIIIHAKQHDFRVAMDIWATDLGPINKLVPYAYMNMIIAHVFQPCVHMFLDNSMYFLH